MRRPESPTAPFAGEPVRHSAAAAPSRVHCAPALLWSVEMRGIRLVDLENGRTRLLTYPDAAIWDFLSRGKSSREIVHLLGAVAGLDPREARTLLLRTLHHWAREGLVVEEVADG